MKKIIFAIVLSVTVILTSNFTNVSAREVIGTTLDVNINEVDAFNNVVVFIKFNDEESYQAPFDYSHYDSIFNAIGTPSLKDYYLEVSYNKLEIDSYLINNYGVEILYYTDVYDRSYFEPYDPDFNPNGYEYAERTEREQDLLKRAIAYVDEQGLVPEDLPLDANDDGYVDSVTFMVSGEDTGWGSLFWPHKWNLFQDVDNPSTINGKLIDTFTFELLGYTQDYAYQGSVGILSHETFHLISAPDLYHYYDQYWIEPAGYWDIMNRSEDVPAHMLGYMKQAYGNWIDEVDEITESGSYTLYPLQDSENNLYRIDLGYSNEYLYIEYRDNDGMYESNLPNEGLIAYRVDLDFEGQGNRYGYGYPQGTDEVFVFRPNMADTEFPIEFPYYDDPEIDEDGDINDAAMSQYNLIDEMGVGTATPMFYSDGTEIYVLIENVVLEDGYMTFDVILTPIVKLSVDSGIQIGDDVFLIDNEYTDYYAEIYNVGSGASIYYTTDGSLPTNLSTPYTEKVAMSVENNVFTALVVESSGTEYYLEKTFQFASSISTVDDPYQEIQDITWVMASEDVMKLELAFETFDLHYMWTYFIIDDGSGEEYYYDPVFDEPLYFTTDYLSITFFSYNEYYVTNSIIDADLTVLQAGVFMELIHTDFFNNETDLNTPYVDPGYYLYNDHLNEYTVNVTNTVDHTVIGEYDITYELIDSELNVVQTLVRTVNVRDNIGPVITLLGEEHMTIEIGEEFIDPMFLWTENYYDTVEMIAVSELDITKAGDYIIIYYAYDPAGNESNILTRTVTVVDTIAPTIMLNGDSEITLELGEYYIEYRAIAIDNSSDSIIVVRSGEVDTMSVGTYIVSYNAMDTSGNEANTVTRTIHIIDTTIPVLSLVGESEITVELGSQYNEPGISVVDLSDEMLGYEASSSLDIMTVGSYIVTYNCADASGNQAEAITRTVHVIDTTAPVVELNGEDVIYVEYGDIYQELDAIVHDLSSDSLTVEIKGVVLQSIIGTYTLRYSAVDASGNESIVVERTVVIQDTTSPTLSLNENIDTIFVGEEYVDEGVIATDKSSYTIDVFNPVQIDTAGMYTIEYTVTDLYDNVTTISRVVTVVEKTIEVEFELGSALTTININDEYIEGDCAVYEDGIYHSCTAASSLDTSVSGVHTITYTYTDSNNATHEYKRYVYVLAETVDEVLYYRKKEGVQA